MDVMAKTLYSQINGQRMYGHVAELSDPSYMGRLAGHEGHSNAAEWVAQKFQVWGLKPAGDNGTYFQEFPIELSYPTAPGRFVMKDPQTGEVIEPNIGHDYTLGFYSESTSLENVEVVFIPGGYYYSDYSYLNVPGKTGGMKKSDFNGLDVQNKICVMPWLYNRLQIANAKSAGAVACLIWDWELETTLSPFGSKERPTLFLSRDTGEYLITGGKTADLTVNYTIEQTTTDNVVAEIPGTDPYVGDEVVIVGAHLDGVGFNWDEKGYAVFPGANDNASGVSAVLEMAKVFKENSPPKRTIRFVAWSGEETGLFGAKYMVDKLIETGEINVEDPSQSKVVAVINFDSMGYQSDPRNPAGFSFYGGLNFPVLYDLIAANAAELDICNRQYSEENPVGFMCNSDDQLNIKADWGPYDQLDSWHFENVGVPAVAANIYNETLQFYYNYPYKFHTVLDTIDLIDKFWLEQYCRMTAATVLEIAWSDQPLTDIQGVHVETPEGLINRRADKRNRKIS
jgi:hypothetical protein